MLQKINPDVSEYTYRYAIDDVMEFERALAGVSLTDVYARFTENGRHGHCASNSIQIFTH